MTEIVKERMTAIVEGNFIVFLIGMRINNFWKIHKWLPIIFAMSKMLNELSANRKLGFISSESWFGRTTLMVQYWESFEHLESYAKNKNFNHLPAWAEYNRKISSSGEVGIWHETYLIPKGGYECIYKNMPNFGLGKVGSLIPASGILKEAKGRVNSGNSQQVAQASVDLPPILVDTSD